MCYAELFITGIPPTWVPNVMIVITEIRSNDIATTLSWKEAFNNFAPILNYTVSCSGDYKCSQFPHTTSGNSTQNHTISSLTLMTTYTFSVVAINSFGSGKAGKAMITTPGEVTLHEYICSYYYYYYVYLAMYVFAVQISWSLAFVKYLCLHTYIHRYVAI